MQKPIDDDSPSEITGCIHGDNTISDLSDTSQSDQSYKKALSKWQKIKLLVQKIQGQDHDETQCLDWLLHSWESDFRLFSSLSKYVSARASHVHASAVVAVGSHLTSELVWCTSLLSVSGSSSCWRGKYHSQKRWEIYIILFAHLLNCESGWTPVPYLAIRRHSHFACMC